MKKITLPADGVFQPAKALEMIVSQPPRDGSGIGVPEMRRRCRILDALENRLGPIVLLEDADWEHLKKLVDGFVFGCAHAEIGALIDAVDNAVEHSASATLAVAAE